MRPPPHAAGVAKGSWLGRLHLANERPWRGHVEQNGLFEPARNNCPDRAFLLHIEGLDKRSIVTPRARSGNRPNMSWSSTSKPTCGPTGGGALTNSGLSDATSVTSLCVSSSRMPAWRRHVLPHIHA